MEEIIHPLKKLLCIKSYDTIDTIKYTVDKDGCVTMIYVYHPFEYIFSISQSTRIQKDEFCSVYETLMRQRKNTINDFGFIIEPSRINGIMESAIAYYDMPCMVLLYGKDTLIDHWRNLLPAGKSVFYENDVMPFINYVIFDYSLFNRMGMLRSICNDSIFIPCSWEVAKQFHIDYNGS